METAAPLSSKTVADATTALSAREAVGSLLNACLSGTLEEFRDAAKELMKDQDSVDAIAAVKDANGRGPLHFAARGGNLEVCKELVENLHLEVDQKDNDGETPLIHAARIGHFETSKFLIDHGAQVSISSLDFGSSPLHHAAGTGSTELIRLFLDSGADINSGSCSGTPLNWAAGHGNSDAVKLLLDCGADPNVLAENGISPLISGAASGSYDVVSLLIKHGAEVNVSAEGGVTALHVAADSGDEKIVRCLLDAGADPNAEDALQDGAKPIHAAAARNARSIVQMLLPLTSQDGKDGSSWSVDGLIAKEAASKTEIFLDKAAEAKARGTEAFKLNDYMTAIDAYTQALDMNPTDASLYSNRSMCWIRTGQAEPALKDARAAVELRPDWAKARYREGVALRHLERFEDAATAFYDGIKLEPSNKELQEAFREAVESGKKRHASQSSQL